MSLSKTKQDRANKRETSTHQKTNVSQFKTAERIRNSRGSLNLQLNTQQCHEKEDLNQLTEQNQLLHESIRVRDREIQQLKCFLSQHYGPHEEIMFLKNQQGLFKGNEMCRGTCRTVNQLTQELDELKYKNQKSTDRIAELQAKLRQVMSRSQLSEQYLKEEVQILKADMRYQREQYERLFDNIKIQSEQKLLCRLKIQEQSHKKQVALLQGQINHLKHECHEKSIEINRLNVKLKNQRQQSESHCKFVENHNKEMQRQMDLFQCQLKKQYKAREEDLIKEFNKDIDILHSQQKRQIQILCKRISHLKVELFEKEQHVKSYWKARDSEAVETFRTKQDREYAEMMKIKQKSIEKSCQLRRSSIDTKNIKTTVSTLPNERKYSEPPLDALRQYMK